MVSGKLYFGFKVEKIIRIKEEKEEEVGKDKKRVYNNDDHNIFLKKRLF